MGLFKKKEEQQTAQNGPKDPIICPFCGRASKSEKHCSACGAKFNKEVLAHAFRESKDPRTDMIGPFTMKTAKRLLWGFMILMIVAFVAITESVKYNPLFN